MKNIIVILFVSFSFQLCGQKLTNKEVFDYLPGDVFQYVKTDFPQLNVSCAYKSIDTYYTDSIIDKRIVSTGDTIFYTIQYTEYKPLQCDPKIPPLYITGTKMLKVINLDSLASHFNYQGCPFSKSDSFYVSKPLCNAVVWEYHTNKVSTDSCFEPAEWSSVFVKGCGGPFVSYGDGTSVYTTKLIYYKKGNGSCGNYVTGINEQVKETGFLSLFPNPSDGRWNINYAIPDGSVGELVIYNSTGHAVQQLKLSHLKNSIAIDGSKYETGNYYCKLIVDGSNSVTQKLIIVR